MMKLLFVLVFFACISLGGCLKCYQCLSARDWDDCDSRKTKVTCSLGQQTCAKFEQELRSWGGSIYAKGCTNTEAWCKEVLKTDNCRDHCVAYCCSKDLCNEATVPMASVVTLLACVFVAFLR
ncbi:hypothetical protein ACROYT_G008313 [Oculina patagonica]